MKRLHSVSGGVGAEVQARILAALARTAGLFRHRGVSRATWHLARVFGRDNSAILRIDSDALLRVYLDDGRWTALFDPRYRYEPEIHRLLQTLLSPQTYFLDGGANSGYWSVLAQRRCRKVLAVEAAPKIFERLEDNAALNGSEVTACHGALWRADGESLTIVTHARRHARSSVVRRRNEVGRHGYFSELVTSVTIDSVTREHFSDPSAPVVIKLDVEGAEIPAIEGAERTLAERDAVLLYEDHGRDPSSSVSVYLADRGFALFANPPGSTPRQVTPREIVAMKIDPRKGYNFAACQPDSDFTGKLLSCRGS
jgi:FkbM family methyltransferase